ncbi:phenylacetate--CoA ligase family protein [Acetobacterium woodii]|uniref:Coenzyme F390 synthetase-like protein n=1 Tax=Acetobacterium woodii (strain ATCC 29683 / DSM 1030 / JCM 2381 / KCTC 1655 / WB1) TaxID=931626 RepID=H6LK62_ACEWD|nr:AMP-binding protein [Acetobacterium woodii]AFA49982.1 coenzyme F390 synthetase-like protein [Acetobacterium woodii DSM 1030]
MKKMSLIKSIWLCSQYPKKSALAKARIRAARLNRLVDYAKQNSPYYQAHYQNIGEHFKLRDLPPTNKVDLMAHFDEWITEKDITLNEVEVFMKDLDNIGRKIKGKYLVFTTSGSTGNPLVALYDQTTNNVMAGINMLRSFVRKEDYRAFLKGGGKTMGVFATGGFYLGNSSVRARLLAMPWKKRQFGVTSALAPIARIVEELNAFKPTMLGGYPTILELLIDEQKKGRLQIQPVLIMTGGEYLSPQLRRALEEAFGCTVQTSYSCTEGGTIACECSEKHFHINDDWIIVEPVNDQNEPVADGVQSDKILITNLANYTQPFIRYEVTDRVVMHHEPCPCKNPAPWLTLEGRTDDILTFYEDGKMIKISPLAIYATLKEIHGIVRFQLIAYEGNELELRIIARAEDNPQDLFEEAAKNLTAFLATHGVKQVRIFFSDKLPMQHPQSGKFKHIIYNGNLSMPETP